MTQAKFTFPDGRTVHRLGLGTMRLTGQPGNFGPFEDWEAGKTLLRTAADNGVDFFDTARAYGPHWGERIIGEALAEYGDRVFVASKGGIEKNGPTGAHIRRDGRPDRLKVHVDESLEALGRDIIDLYYLHSPDPSVPFADSIGALEEARLAGKIARIGVSNATLDQLREAMAIAPISAVQNRYDPVNGGDEAVLDATVQAGIAFVPWGPLGANPMKPGSPFAETGAMGVTDAIKALLDRAPNVLPIPGTRSVDHLLANLKAAAA
ncbi:MAG: aldo/keto reductase [Pseudomonadota bacterium]